MIKTFDPTWLFDNLTKVGRLTTPPPAQYGIIVLRERGEDHVGVEVFRTQKNSILLYKNDRPRGAQTLTREISERQYSELVKALDIPEYKRIGGVAAGEKLDGESYLVRYHESAGITSVALVNIRDSDEPMLNNYLNALDSFIKQAHRLAR